MTAATSSSSSPGALHLAEVRLVGAGAPTEPVDVVVAGGVVTQVLPGGSPADRGTVPVPSAGRWLLPGLWDHHVHVTQWVNRRRRLDLVGTDSAAAVLAVVRGALAAGPGGAGGADRGSGGAEPLVGYGFRDGLWPDTPTRAALDEVGGGRPLVMISGDLHCGWLNGAAAALLGVTTDDVGVLREGPWMAALDRLDRAAPPRTADYRAAADAAAARGVVGIVDFENDDNLGLWPQRVADGVDALRVEASVWPDRLQAALAAGLRTGDLLPPAPGAAPHPAGLVRMGRLKVVSDGSLNTRTAYCWEAYPGREHGAPGAHGIDVVPAPELEQLLVSAAAGGIRPAVHAIGDRSFSDLLDVLERTGIRAVVEHAQLLRRDDLPRMGALLEYASVQPEHALDDRDVLEVHWPGRAGRAYAFRSMLDAGVPLRLGSDAPVAPLDPWLAVSAAADRTRDGREAWQPQEGVTRAEALAASVRTAGQAGRGRTAVAVGDVADLVLLDADPLTAAPEVLREMPVAATLLAGRFTWRGGLGA